jgi:hypothetical protein
MAENISNRTLIVLLVAAIAVSVLGVWVSLRGQSTMVTGASTSQIGTVSLSVSEFIGISILDNSIEFGNITGTQGLVTCTVNSGQNNSGQAHNGDPNGSSGNLVTNFTCNSQDPACFCSQTTNLNNTDFFIIENSGNTPVNLTINASINATTFFGGDTNALEQFYAFNQETGACADGLITANTSLLGHGDPGQLPQNVCSCLQPEDAKDSVGIALVEVLTNASTPGNKTKTIEFRVTSAAGCV